MTSNTVHTTQHKTTHILYMFVFYFMLHVLIIHIDHK